VRPSTDFRDSRTCRFPAVEPFSARHRSRLIAALFLALLATNVSCVSFGRRPAYFQVGEASWYGKPYHGRRTANGEIYNMRKLTAAHQTLPFDTRVRVTNLRNGRSVGVRINDRGPFVKGRIIDLSWAAARKLKMVEDGIAPVGLELLD